MRQFQQLSPERTEQLFVSMPQEFTDADERSTVALALGATLYVPANRPDLANAIQRRYREGVCSMVLDLEDAIADHEVTDAVASLAVTLRELADTDVADMLLFVRVRDVDGMTAVVAELGDAIRVLSGFVLPKFTVAKGAEFLDRVAWASAQAGKHFYAMPVMETSQLVHRQTRDGELAGIAELLDAHRDQVLAVRIGATDMCSTFGIRRDRDLTIYDVRVVADVIADIVNYLGRSDGTGFTISGPVWEYFADHERMFRPLLRATPFEEQDAVLFRQHLVTRDLDGLLREIALDRANGLWGKTVIHPSHVAAVHALSAVTHEEYLDAVDILGSDAGGVQASGYRNKMNERRPHRSWAQQVLLRSKVFGVTHQGVTFVDLLTAVVER